MVRNRGVLVASFFTCVFLVVPSSIRAQRTATRTMAPPPATAPMRPAGPVRAIRSSRPVAVRGSGAAQPARVPMRRWNSVRVNGQRTVDRTSRGANGVMSQQVEDQFQSVVPAGAPIDLEQLLNITPTNGFNWQHVNAINQDLPLKAIVDPVTRLEISQAEHLLRIAGGQFSGAYIVGGGGSYYVPEETGEEQQAPPAEEGQPEAQQQGETAQPRVIVLQQKASETQASTPPVLSNEGNFTLILRNGQKIDAIAFTRVDDKIVYITPDGDRKTIDASELDSAATMRVNQEHGMALQLSGS